MYPWILQLGTKLLDKLLDGIVQKVAEVIVRAAVAEWSKIRVHLKKSRRRSRATLTTNYDELLLLWETESVPAHLFLSPHHGTKPGKYRFYR